ncbi:GIY-YIG nuclease family protein [Micromonospora sp. CP22]|uniref:GIY-YIG nuclease family protein n=1 Tax=Micromonospora sp. CP22 TaxID=2580517 RepID=UPI0035C93D89
MAGLDRIDENHLTNWMYDHLRVITVPCDDADTLGRLEEAVLGEMDPVLNLKGMSRTAIRARITELRRRYT